MRLGKKYRIEEGPHKLLLDLVYLSINNLPSSDNTAMPLDSSVPEGMTWQPLKSNRHEYTLEIMDQR